MRCYRLPDCPGRDGIVVDGAVEREELGIPAELALLVLSADAAV